MFAEAAKKRQLATLKQNRNPHDTVQESLPERSESRPQATDEAAELFGVSGRSVRDALYPPKIGPSSRLTYQSGNNMVTV